MRVRELTKQYDGKTVVDGVSFEIPKRKVLSLIGPNGAGKSTVMGIISRLIARDAGLVDFEGRDITKWKSKELSKRLAILTQSNQIQMKLTVRELVAFGQEKAALHLQFYSEEREQEAELTIQNGRRSASLNGVRFTPESLLHMNNADFCFNL